LREKIIGRKGLNPVTQMRDGARQRNLSSSSCCSGSGENQDKRRRTSSSNGVKDSEDKRRGFRTPVQDVEGRYMERRRIDADGCSRRQVYGVRSESRYSSADGEGKFEVSLGYKTQKQLFPSSSSDNDIDIRNDPEFRFGYARTDEEERFEKMYKMAKELKMLRDKINLSQDENQHLRWKLNVADNQVSEIKSILNVKEDDLKDAERELLSTRRKLETDEVLVKDLVFENRNKREYIDKLEKEINDLKKTKSKLLGENTQIRKLAKEISDDSDNLLKVINDLKAEKIDAVLKAEKKDTVGKIINLLESKDEENSVRKEDNKDDENLSSDDHPEEVNETQAMSEQQKEVIVQQNTSQV